jgi:hypothetical protein
VSREWLRELHPPYLAERGGPDLQPEPFEDAMRWACKAAYATSGLLVGNYSQGYAAFDYLLNAPGLPPVPDHLWEALVTRSGPADAYDMGLVAHQANQFARAVRALERARASGAAGADFLLAIAVGDRGWPRQAVRNLEDVVRGRRAELGPLHPDTLSARHQLAFFTGEAGDARAAGAAFRRLVADTTAALGPDHTDTLAARHQQAGSSKAFCGIDYDAKDRSTRKSSPPAAVSSGSAASTRIRPRRSGTCRNSCGTRGTSWGRTIRTPSPSSARRRPSRPGRAARAKRWRPSPGW